MKAHFSPPLFRTAAWAVCLAFILGVVPVVAAEYQGPVFPGERAADATLNEPLPLPKRNPLLQRPNNSTQVVCDDLDPISSIIPRSILDEEEIELQPARVIRPNRMSTRMSQILDHDDSIFMDDSEYIQGGICRPARHVKGEVAGSKCSYDMNGYLAGPIPITFGMGLFDNLTLFADTTAFKTELSDGAGSFGLGQGINWSTPITPQGTVAAQYGVRTIQGDLFSRSTRHQTFMTAGIFKRFDLVPLQGGIAMDWLHDHSVFGSVNLRQMRCELSTRSFMNLEYGFICGFDAFRDRPTTPGIDGLAFQRVLGTRGTVDVQDYYLLFARKHLANGGQVEFRCGATERGDLMLSALGEAAISDRLAVNGGFSVLAPSEGKSIRGNERESWSMSLGIILYFRGGAASRPANMYRPMFDIAGNNSFFTRVIGR